MSEDQLALPTFLPRTAIVGIRNIYDFPYGLLELNDVFKRSLPCQNKTIFKSLKFVFVYLSKLR